jgi:hypothetical protein
LTEDERHAVLTPENAVTLNWKNGEVATTDGPYAETKEQLGGIQILEARDLNHAIQLGSQLPGFKICAPRCCARACGARKDSF